MKKKLQRKINEKKFPVLVACPTPRNPDNISSRLSHYLTMAAARGISLDTYVASRAAECGRNAIIKDFLTVDEYKSFEYLFFIDSDNVPADPFALEKMIAFNKPVVAGISPIAIETDDPMTLIPAIHGQIEMMWSVVKMVSDDVIELCPVCNSSAKTLQDGPKYQIACSKCGYTLGEYDNKKLCIEEWNARNLQLHQMPNKPFKAYRVGGTCILLKRCVLEALKPPYQKSTFDDDVIHFKKGEDYYFCDKIRKAGFDIWVDPSIINHHFHTMDMLKVMDLMLRASRVNR